MATICGVEEAGRGPVIGPMVMCGVLIDEGDEDKLRSIGAKDSKLLTPRTREALFGQITKMVRRYKFIVIPPSEIDHALLDETLNLNWLEADKSAEIINELKPDKAILDCPSNNERAYAAYVRKKLEDPGIELVAEHKADVLYPVVSAASVIAKVIRDRQIENIKKEIGVNFGSGYPADEITARFLRENWDKYPGIFRKTWSSYKAVAMQKDQKKLGEF
ncbi:ribonuclease HII [Candidatus Woesearchaeota archaeon]|nr:ribonuclease HII [Candidatus Woesearchaeota archaeon]